MRVRRSDIVDIEKMHRNFDISTDIDTGSVIIENFDREYMKGNGYGVWNIDGTMFLEKGVMYRHNQEMDSLTKDSINATFLLNTEPDPDKMSLYEFIMHVCGNMVQLSILQMGTHLNGSKVWDQKI